MTGLPASMYVYAAQANTYLAQLPTETPRGPEFGKASPIGIPVVLLLLIATALLVWNMNSHLQKLPKSFDAENPEADQIADEGTDRAGVLSEIDPTLVDGEEAQFGEAVGDASAGVEPEGEGPETVGDPRPEKGSNST